MFVGVSVREVRDLQATLRQQVRRLQPGDVALSDAPPMWEAYDRIERLAASAKMLLEDRVEESRAWAREGDKSPADHLARKSGRSKGAARRSLETSKKLRKLPHTQQALRRGELSQSQAEAIANAAANNPDAEQSLLEAAKTHSLAELRRRCGRAKAAGDPDPDATHRRIHRERYLRRFTDSEDAWNIQGCGTPEAGAIFNTILDPIVNEIFGAARRDGRREPRTAYEFDALIELARRAGATDDFAPSSTGGSPNYVTGNGSGTDDAGRTSATDTSTLNTEASRPSPASGGASQPAATDGEPNRTTGADATGSGGPDSQRSSPQRRPNGRPRPARPTPRFLALLRIDHEALVRGYTEGDELCEITGVGPIPVSVARDLLGDAILKLVITKGVDVVNVTHLGRGPSAAQRIAALWTSPYCTNLGCPNTLQIQHDHRQPWSEVQETVLGNLDRLCPRCHYLKTHKGWALVPGKGRRPLVAPHDPRHPNNSTRPGDRSAAAPTSSAAAPPSATDPHPTANVPDPSDDPGPANGPPPTLFDDAA